MCPSAGQQQQQQQKEAKKQKKKKQCDPEKRGKLGKGLITTGDKD